MQILGIILFLARPLSPDRSVYIFFISGTGPPVGPYSYSSTVAHIPRQTGLTWAMQISIVHRCGTQNSS